MNYWDYDPSLFGSVAEEDDEPKPVPCECDLRFQGCECGAMDLEMHRRGYWRNPVTKLWEPKP